MRSTCTALILGAALAALPLAGHAIGKNEKGCLVGGAAGGVGGKLLGDHPILGAAAGCAVGTYVVRDRDLKEREAEKREHEKAAHNSAKRHAREREEERAQRDAEQRDRNPPS
ncbi:MAG TPA: hypothetical protein VFJ86_11670 [Usitatibacter sp.]|jgi:hypothetical protein|nr:hypothetical protein [Usitatibacter sp.]